MDIEKYTDTLIESIKKRHFDDFDRLKRYITSHEFNSEGTFADNNHRFSKMYKNTKVSIFVEVSKKSIESELDIVYRDRKKELNVKYCNFSIL